MCLSPWLCFGDFNEICGNHEKKGGHRRGYAAMERLKEALDDCNLDEVGNIGNEMTWCGHYSNAVVMERLCNSNWHNMFPGASFKTLSWWCSDHKPLVVTIPIAGKDIERRKKTKCA